MKLEQELIEVLKIINFFFSKNDINYALIGAQVPRILIKFPVSTNIRPTKDIDLLISTNSWDEFQQLKKKLSKIGFKEEDNNELRFHYKDTIIDIIPYIKDELDNGVLKLPDSGNKINVYGFDRLLDNAIKENISRDLSIPIIPLHLSVYTKILAFLDRGIERNITMDIEDIIYIFQNYESLEVSERRFEIETDGTIDFELLGAYLIGIDLKEYLTDVEKQFVHTFLKHFTDEYSYPIQRIIPYDSNKRIEIFNLFNSFRKGFYS